MKNKEKTNTPEVAYLVGMGIIVISGIFNLIYLLRIPSDPDSAFLLGISFSRFILVLFFFIGISISFVGLLQKSGQRRRNIQVTGKLIQQKGSGTVVVILFVSVSLLTWIACFGPEYLLGKYFAIFERLRPLFLWGEIISIVLFFWISTIHRQFRVRESQSEKKTLLLYGTLAMILLGIFVFISVVYPRITDDLWFGRYSVPILAVQIAFSLGICIITRQLLITLKYNWPDVITRRLDLILFLLIWLIACLVWTPQPIEFMSDLDFSAIEQHLRPMPPAYEIFPWKDSRTYYTITESVINGTGIFRSIDKSLFIVFTSAINWLAKGSYEEMLVFQAGLLAVFPAVIYLIGKNLHNRWAGVLAASFAIFQELNGIRLMDEFPLVSSKVLLSEPYMQLWNALIVLAVILALKNSTKTQSRLFIICGGVLGLSALFRLNTFVIIPFLLLLFFLVYLKEKKLFLKASLFFMIGLLISLTPWMVHNAVKYDDPFAFIRAKTEGVIIKNRYSKYYSVDPIQIENNPVPESIDLSLEKVGQVGVDQASFIPLLIKSDSSLVNMDGESLPDLTQMSNILASIFRHFLNNLVTSFSILPVSAHPQDLFHGARTQQFWGNDSGQYASIDLVIVLLNLTIIAIGIATALRKHKMVALAPIAVYLGYHLSNAIAISSGNRYAQPASWIIFFYFAIGLAALSGWFLRKVNPLDASGSSLLEDHQPKPFSMNYKNRANLLIAIIIFLSLSPVLVDLLPPSRFQIERPELLVAVLFDNPACNLALEEQGIDSIVTFNRRYNQNRYVLDYGKIYFPLSINALKYNEIFKPPVDQIGGSGQFTTVFFLSQSNMKTRQLIIPDNEKIDSMKSGLDVVIITPRWKDTSRISMLALMDLEDIRVINEDVLVQSDMHCLFFSQ